MSTPSDVERTVGHISAIPVDEGRMLRVDGHLVAVFHLRGGGGGGVRATQPWCPHRGGPLADGLVGDATLVCPLHGRTFSLDGGEAGTDEVGIRTYPARVDDDGSILLTLPADGPLPACSDDVPATAPPGPQAGTAPFAEDISQAPDPGSSPR